MGDPLSTGAAAAEDPAAANIHGDRRWIWFITGPTACGKTTIAKALACHLGFTFVEGDDGKYHPQANVDKMARGEPLTDEDRRAWLVALRNRETASPSSCPSPPPSSLGGAAQSPHLVITCSALKKQYRDVLRQGNLNDTNLRVRFVLLDVDEPVLRERAARRRGHFAGEALISSQLATLERPREGDEPDVLVVRVTGEEEEEERDADETAREVEARVREEMGRDEGSFLRVL